MFALVILVLLILALFYGVNQSKHSFRRVLVGELRQWLEEGIIQPAQAARIGEKYQLERLGEESQATLLKTLFMFGAVLIALGVVAFIAAHWEAIPKSGKITLVTLAMLLAHFFGYWLWNRKDSPYLGHALVILGSLIFGANIALIAQVFHIQSDYYNGFLLWSCGALLMGYAIQSSPHLLVAIVASLVWFAGWNGDHPFSAPWYLILLPAAVLPYAYRNNSRGVHFLVWPVWGGAAALFMVPLQLNHTVFWLVPTIAAISLFFWGYGDWPAVRQREDFRHDTKLLSFFIMGVLGFIISFHDVVAGLESSGWNGLSFWRTIVESGLWVVAIGVVAYGYFGQKDREKVIPYLIIIGSGILLADIGILRGTWAMPAGTVAANIVVVILGGYLFWEGLAKLDRSYFWLGLGLLIAEVIGRFFEYETGLLWKSASFIFAGLVLIYGGIIFEKKRGRINRDAA